MFMLVSNVLNIWSIYIIAFVFNFLMFIFERERETDRQTAQAGEGQR